MDHFVTTSCELNNFHTNHLIRFSITCSRRQYAKACLYRETALCTTVVLSRPSSRQPRQQRKQIVLNYEYFINSQERYLKMAPPNDRQIMAAMKSATDSIFKSDRDNLSVRAVRQKVIDDLDLDEAFFSQSTNEKWYSESKTWIKSYAVCFPSTKFFLTRSLIGVSAIAKTNRWRRRKY